MSKLFWTIILSISLFITSNNYYTAQKIRQTTYKTQTVNQLVYTDTSGEYTSGNILKACKWDAKIIEGYYGSPFDSNGYYVNIRWVDSCGVQNAIFRVGNGTKYSYLIGCKVYIYFDKQTDKLLDSFKIKI